MVLPGGVELGSRSVGKRRDAAVGRPRDGRRSLRWARIRCVAVATEERTETMVCYRHPSQETAVTCSTCGRPICPDCMVFAAVGIKCPECAGRTTGAKRTARRIGSAAGQGTGAIVTKVLIGTNVAVYLLQIAQSSDARGDAGQLFE